MIKSKLLNQILNSFWLQKSSSSFQKSFNFYQMFCVSELKSSFCTVHPFFISWNHPEIVKKVLWRYLYGCFSLHFHQDCFPSFLEPLKTILLLTSSMFLSSSTHFLTTTWHHPWRSNFNSMAAQLDHKLHVLFERGGFVGEPTKNGVVQCSFQFPILKLWKTTRKKIPPKWVMKQWILLRVGCRARMC